MAGHHVAVDEGRVAKPAAELVFLRVCFHVFLNEIFR